MRSWGECVAKPEKSRRIRWVMMLNQLRFGSGTVPDVLPGNCQDMLDHLFRREWRGDGEPKMPRYSTHRLEIRKATAQELLGMLPEWARGCMREPGSDDGMPIFFEHDGVCAYLDGRRRINKWFRECPEKNHKFWVIIV